MVKPRKMKHKNVSLITDRATVQRVKTKMAKPIERPFSEAYPADKLKKLVSDLRSNEPRREVDASVEFFNHHDEIVIAINNTPNLSETEVFNKVVEDIIKDQELFFKKLERERQLKALKFLVESKAIPDKIQNRAKALFEKLGGAKAPVKIEKKEIGVEPFSQAELKRFLTEVKSRTVEKAVPAVVNFLSNYQSFAGAVNKAPNLSVTEVNKKVFSVLQKHEEAILQQLRETGNVKALTFLTRFSAAPPEMQKRAAEVLKIVQPQATAKEVKIVAMPAKVKEYTAEEVTALFSRLQSKDVKEAVVAAVEFITNYNEVVEAVMKAPMLSVTDITKKAVDVISRNSSQVFKALESTRNSSALKFLSTSAKMPDGIKKTASAVLARVTAAVAKKEKKKDQMGKLLAEDDEGEEGEDKDEEEEQADEK